MANLNFVSGCLPSTSPREHAGSFALPVKLLFCFVKSGWQKQHNSICWAVLRAFLANCGRASWVIEAFVNIKHMTNGVPRHKALPSANASDIFWPLDPSHTVMAIFCFVFLLVSEQLHTCSPWWQARCSADEELNLHKRTNGPRFHRKQNSSTDRQICLGKEGTLNIRLKPNSLE